MTINYTGNSAYCYSNSLHMVLKASGIETVPSVGLIECMTGMPFGSTFIDFGVPQLFPSPPAANPDEGLDIAIKTLGWTCEVWRGDEEEQALKQLKSAIQESPVLLGPLDMGYLSYDPNASQKRGADHFLVPIKIEDEMVCMHDPQLYPYAVLPISDLMRAWNAKDIGYVNTSFTIRHQFRQKYEVNQMTVYNSILQTVKTIRKQPLPHPSFLGNSKAFVKVVELLQSDPPPSLVEILIGFSFPVGAKRCSDAYSFFEEFGIQDAAKLMLAKAQLYGRSQYYAVQGNWKETANCLTELAYLEESPILEQLSSVNTLE